MNEYILKQDVIDTIMGQPPDAHYPSWYATQIEELPPADVAEIKHGEWMSVPEMWGMFDIRYYCSECGNDAIINNSERYVLSDYCPHCGAIMDNKRGNENA